MKAIQRGYKRYFAPEISSFPPVSVWLWLHHPKTSIIFFVGYDKTVKAFLFDASELDEGSEDKACIRTFKGHNKGVYPLIFIPAEESYCLPTDTEGPVINPGDVLISGSADSTARSWSFDTGGCLKIFKGHSGAVTTMATDAIGKILYTAGADALIKSWNISTGQVLKVNTHIVHHHHSSCR